MKRLHRPAKYIVVAGLSALTDWIVFSILLATVGDHYIQAQMVSRIAGGLFSFLANKYWSFDSKVAYRTLVEGRRFLLVYLVSYISSLVLLYFFWEVLGIFPYFAKLMTDTTCLVLNYIVMQSYVFRERQGLIHLCLNGLKKVFR